MHAALVRIWQGWAHHAGDATGHVDHLPGDALLGVGRPDGGEVQFACSLWQCSNDRSAESLITWQEHNKMLSYSRPM